MQNDDCQYFNRLSFPGERTRVNKGEERGKLQPIGAIEVTDVLRVGMLN